MKRIKKEKINDIVQKLLDTEINIMIKINHPNIIHLHQFLESKNNFYLVVDFCNHGDLEIYMKKRNITYFDESEARGIMM